MILLLTQKKIFLKIFDFNKYKLLIKKNNIYLFFILDLLLSLTYIVQRNIRLNKIKIKNKIKELNSTYNLIFFLFKYNYFFVYIL